MRKFTVVLFLLLISTSLFGQNNFKNLDFYLKKLEQLPKNSDTITFYANKILEKGQASNSKKEIGFANKYLAEAAFMEGRDKDAAVFLNKAFSCFTNVTGVEEDVADCYRVLARIETLDKKYDLAYEHLSKAKLLYKKVEKLKRPDSYYFLLNNIAYLYILTEKYDKALEILNANQKKHVSDLVLANIYSLFSIISNEQSDFKESIKYFEQTKIIYERLKESNAALICEMNIAINYYYLKNYKVAIKGLNEVLRKTTKQKTQPSVLVRIHLFLSMCYFEQGKYDIADAYFNKAEAIIAKGNLDFLSFQNIWLENKVTFLIHKKKYAEAKTLLINHLNKDKKLPISSKIVYYELLKTIARETNHSSDFKIYNDSISEFKMKDELSNQKSVIDLMRAEFKYKMGITKHNLVIVFRLYLTMGFL
jgi:tetratricopeptide (TPR) repeat protein